MSECRADRNRDERKHDEALANFKTCEINYMFALSDLLPLSQASDNAKNVHVQCRRAEGGLYDDLQTCNSEKADLYDAFVDASAACDEAAKDVGVGARNQHCAPQPPINLGIGAGTAEEWNDYRTAMQPGKSNVQILTLHVWQRRTIAV